MITITKPVKLSETQRKALRSLYSAHRSGKDVPYDDRPTQPTLFALLKHGLIDGDVSEKTWRGNARIWDAKINAKGIELADELFGMDWWSQLIGAFISYHRDQQAAIERDNKSEEISRKFNVSNDRFEYSGKENAYRAYLKSQSARITVERPFSYSDTANNYAVTLDIDRWIRFHPDQAENVAELLDEAAHICRMFQQDLTK